MLRPIRGTPLLRRAFATAPRRLLHEDSSSRGADFVAFSVKKNSLAADPRFGMDMTRAPGYEIAADDDAPLVGHHKMADFAIRHARLSFAQVNAAHGYIWVGNVLYPSGLPADADPPFTWEISVEEDHDSNSIPSEQVDSPVAVGEPPDAPSAPSAPSATPVEAKRRYSGGQARRIRRERERIATRKTLRTTKRRPLRKPKNDLPDDDDDV